MRRRLLLALISTELAMMLGLPLGYAMGYEIVHPGCAPPSMGCLRPDVACFAICGDAWQEFPAVMAEGARIGILPAILSLVLVYTVSQYPPLSERRTRFVLASTGVQMIPLLLGVWAVSSVYVHMLPVVLPLTFLIGAGVLAAVNVSGSWLVLRGEAGVQ